MLDRIKSVDVAVVNLAFEGSSVLPVDGFGYLVPATENTGVLGTVFDSCAMPLQNSRPDTTRLTVMLGGHKFSKYYNCENVDNLEKYFLSIALDTVRNHLGINIKPLAHKVHIHRQCIPQYQVGHTQLTSEIKSWLANHCSGRLELLGSSFNGVSVNDCIKTAREIATS